MVRCRFGRRVAPARDRSHQHLPRRWRSRRRRNRQPGAIVRIDLDRARAFSRAPDCSTEQHASESAQPASILRRKSRIHSSD